MAATDILPLIIDNASIRHDKSPIGTHYSTHQKAECVRYVSASTEDAKAAVDSSHKAFKSWSNTLPRTRRAVLQTTAALIRENFNRLAQLQVVETNCTEMWAAQNIEWAALHLEEMAGRITSALNGELPVVHTPGQTAMVFKRPVGPVLSIPPWNASVYLACRTILAPIAVGCTVVLKVSEQSPGTHHFLASLFHRAGLPPGVLNVIQVRREDAAEVTEAIIAHQHLRKIEFIGSAAVGKNVGAMAGKHLKPILMELGGKAPALILEDADLAYAANSCVTGSYSHHGQTCFSTERLIVKSAVLDQFLAELKKSAAQFPQPGAVSCAGAERPLRLVKEAISKGAKVLYGEAKLLDEAQFQPVILTGITTEMEISDEESFGPVLAIYPVDTDGEAIELANSTKYGLSAAVFSKDVGRALEIAGQIDAGQTHINWPFATMNDEATIPVCCTKGSGWGKANGGYGLQEFLDFRTVTFTNPATFAAAMASHASSQNGAQNGA